MEALIFLAIVVVFMLLATNWKLRYIFGIGYGVVGFFTFHENENKFIAILIAAGSLIMLRIVLLADKKK